MGHFPRHHSDYHNLLSCHRRDHVDWCRAQEVPSQRQNHYDAIHTGVYSHSNALLRWPLVRQARLPHIFQAVGTAQCHKPTTLVVYCVDDNNRQLSGLLHNAALPLHACEL